jgi:penicillin V acylase-like amidase (Ntn superfamily)
MKHLARMLSILVCGLLVVPAAFPCTTFVLQGDGRVYFGRNLDWFWENGLVFVNQRNVEKTSMVAPGSLAAKWTSKYGSVTFNQFGMELPLGGMNEAGLVVENLWLDETKYPAADSRPGINLSQWIQYQLDNCRTVEEVLATDKQIRIEPLAVPAGIHYLICDAAGECATIEFLNGAMVSRRHEKMPYQVLANDTYDQSVAYKRAHPSEGDSKPLKNVSSQERFARAASCVAGFKPGKPAQDVAYAFDTLEQVHQGDFTVWRMVYEVSGRRIHYRTRSNPKERVLDLKKLDFSCGHPLQFMDIQTKPSANGTLDFQSLSEAALRKYLTPFFAQESLKKQFGDLAPQIEIQLLALKSYACATR